VCEVCIKVLLIAIETFERIVGNLAELGSAGFVAHVGGAGKFSAKENTGGERYERRRHCPRFRTRGTCAFT
jgi:hypothetical protein